MPRPDGRANDQLRPLVLERQANPYAEGSCLIRMGGTLVHCTASVEAGVPGFKKGSGEGWVTAEYAMLPRATLERTSRERNGPGGRTQEIQRLIGRSLRAAMAHDGLRRVHHPDRLRRAPGRRRHPNGQHHRRLRRAGRCLRLAGRDRPAQPSPFGRLVAAVSVGVIEGEVRLDLSYVEDKDARGRLPTS